MYVRLFFLFILSLLVFCCDDVQQGQEAESLHPERKTPEFIPSDTSVANPEKTIPVPDYDTSQWSELIRLDETIVLDMRYATINNFVKEQLYDCGRCFLRPEAAKAVAEANQALGKLGLRLKMFDCFRPLPVQQRLWDKFQNPSYVTPPSKGSMHNRGLAVDLTIIDQTGEELDMGTEFDFFGKEAHHTYTGHSEEVNKNRLLLKKTMEDAGFRGIRTEWWHYSYSKRTYKLSEMLWNCPVPDKD